MKLFLTTDMDQPRGNTATELGFIKAAEMFTWSVSNRFVVLFTDGEPTDNPYAEANKLKVKC